jgi:hypothetical protein
VEFWAIKSSRGSNSAEDVIGDVTASVVDSTRIGVGMKGVMALDVSTDWV